MVVNLLQNPIQHTLVGVTDVKSWSNVRIVGEELGVDDQEIKSKSIVSLDNDSLENTNLSNIILLEMICLNIL